MIGPPNHTSEFDRSATTNLMIQREEFSSGKHVTRRFDADGRLASETHTYGAVDIGLIIDYVAGEDVRETYIIKNQLVSRKRYEQGRTQFPDMPPANASCVDTFQELSAARAQERRDRRKAARTREPNPEKASQTDAFCRALMARGTRANAFEWLEEKSNTLGELTNHASKQLVTKLQRVGCRQVHACDITTYDQLGSNTGHLVVELPDEGGARAAVFRQVDRLAWEQGLSGDFDDGQHYAYIKLD
jgi:hypothetical protein